MALVLCCLYIHIPKTTLLALIVSKLLPSPLISLLINPIYTGFPMLNLWFSDIINMSLTFKEAVSLWVFDILGGFRTGVFVRMMKRAVYVAFTCILALGGAMVGIIVGAMKGQTTETGFVRGAGIGAVAGAITAVQLLESAADGESLSKVALLTSLFNGKVFVEWVSPAILKAYQWQVSLNNSEPYREISDVYDVAGVTGLSKSVIQKLPECKIKQCHEHCCSICLQDFDDGECARKLPNCGHFYHLDCIDKWLSRNGTCPVCRKYVCEDEDDDAHCNTW